MSSIKPLCLQQHLLSRAIPAAAARSSNCRCRWASLVLLLPVILVVCGAGSLQGGEECLHPTLLMHLPFDGSAEAKVAGGQSKPIQLRNVSFEPGVRGQAVRISPTTLLEYASAGNLRQEAGTVSCWFKPAWRLRDVRHGARSGWRSLFSHPLQNPRLGSGMLWLWFWGPLLRADTSNDIGNWVMAGLPSEDEWMHISFAWSAQGKRLFVDGREAGFGSDGSSPLQEAKETFSKRSILPSFFVGSTGDIRQADGLIDEFRIYDAPFSAEVAAAAFAAFIPFDLQCRSGRVQPGHPARIKWGLSGAPDAALPATTWRLADPAGTVVAQGECAKPAAGLANTIDFMAEKPGEYRLSIAYVGAPPRHRPVWCTTPEAEFQKSADQQLETELLESIDFAEALPTERFTANGPTTIGHLGARAFLQGGMEKNNRFALRVQVPEAGVPYLVEWDYPDDTVRTMELIVHATVDAGDDYSLQSGVFCGGEYPNSGRMLTHRSVLWPREKDLAFVFMTARTDAPVAIATLRISRIIGGLPAAMDEKAIPASGGRNLGVYFEDPAVSFDFGMPNGAMPYFDGTISRLAAYMKWSGQNLFCYPAVWYHGRIENYMPRVHPPGFVSRILERFEAEGLAFMPTINLHNLTLKTALGDGFATDGSMHPTAAMILASGRTNGRWHGSPPNFNPLHPDMIRYVEGEIDTLLDRHGRSPAFKGVVLHLTKHTCPWFGSIEAGYNDYCIEAFEQETGIKPLVDRTDPLRGKLYHDWLMAHARERWVDWRCRKLAAWYKSLAARVAACRPDLQLGLFSYEPVVRQEEPRSGQAGFSLLANREAGLDPALLGSDEHIILCQTTYPADYRWRHGSFPAAVLERMKEPERKPETFAMIATAGSPWINIHDRYFEDGIDATSPLPAEWLKSRMWRASTLNANSTEFIGQYVLPLRHQDILGFTKGGFLIGTCGGEEQLRSFARAFRPLPASRFADVPGSTATVKVRSLATAQGLWVYAVNTERTPARIDLVATDLAELPGRTPLGSPVIDLAPYQLRSFLAPAGSQISQVREVTP